MDEPVALTSTGVYGEATYRIEGEVEVEERINPALGALTIDVDNPQMNIGASGDALTISGFDEAGRSDHHGVGISNSTVAEQAREEQSGSDGGLCASGGGTNVEGVGGDCDVVHDPDIDFEELIEEVRSLASDDAGGDMEDICSSGGPPSGSPGPPGGPPGQNSNSNASDGSSSQSPKVYTVDGNCDLRGNAEGTDILYIAEGEGEGIEMRGNSEWNGLIITEEPASGLVQKGNPKINGAIIQVGDGDVDLRGNVTIQYNSDMLQGLTSLSDGVAEGLQEPEAQLMDRTADFVDS